MKFRSLWSIGGIVVIICAAVFAVHYLERIPSHRLAALLGVTVTVSDRQGAPSRTPQLTPEQVVTSSDVAVQTFSGPTLVRQGSGVAVSADGLILTTTAAAPYGSGSFVYQVAVSQDKIMRAQRITSDPALGLALLKIEASDLDAVLFDTAPIPHAGAQCMAIAPQFVLSRFTVVQLPTWIAWSESGSAAALSLDRAYAAQTNGARVVCEDGRSVGMVRWGGQSTLTGAAQINGFLERYLARSSQH